MIRRLPQTNLKIACPGCGQKLDASEIPAFEYVECPACGADLVIPYRFGQYLLEEPIAESHVAGVYRALDLKLDREVAIKVLDEELSDDEAVVALFLKLGRRIAVLNHGNIIPIYSSGEFQGLPFLVMELMVNLSVRDMLEQTSGPPSISRALHIAEQAARGLEAANREGVNHHNLTPGNILLGAEDMVKLTDFGMEAVRLSAIEIEHHTGRLHLDAGYMSPEILRGGQADCRADVYSLGAVLYHMLSGRRPFTGNRSQRIQTSDARPVEDCKALRPELSRELSQFVSKMMSPDPEQRPRTLQAVIRSLAVHRGQLPNVAFKKKTSSASVGSNTRAASASHQHRAANRAQRLVRRGVHAARRKGCLHQLLDAAIVGVVIILVVLLVYLFLQGRL